VLEELEHPFVGHSVEKAANVRFYHVAHPPLLDCSAQFVQATVLASSRSVPIAAVFEDLLVKRFQNPLNRHFNYLVFKTANSKRSPLLTARFGNIAPASGLGPVPHTLQPIRQVLKVPFEILPVLLLGYAVHTDGFGSVQCVIAGPQVVGVCHMMVQ